MNPSKPFFSHLGLLKKPATICRWQAGLVLSSVCLTLANFVQAEPLIAYTHDGAIYTARAADGKDPKKICVGDDPCISNDGRFLVYTQTERTPSKAKHRAKGEDAAPRRAIAARELASGKETPLPTGDAQQVYGAIWSPDGTWIAFNILTAKSWEVAVIHPDGSAFHPITEKLDAKGEGYYLAGWNFHENAVLVENLNTMAQLDPVTGAAAWQRPIQELTGEESCSSGLRCMISADGKLLVSTRFVDDDEFSNLDGPSSYLVLTELPDGKPKRVTPKKFDAANPWLDLAGASIYLRGFSEQDVKPTKGGDGVKLKMRIYRYDVSSGKLAPLIEGGDMPSVSRG